jgi:hypothetical protein
LRLCAEKKTGPTKGFELNHYAKNTKKFFNFLILPSPLPALLIEIANPPAPAAVP